MARMMKALSIMQPWAWLIVHGHKDIENRCWAHPPMFRGRFLVHAGKRLDKDGYQFMRRIIGENGNPKIGAIKLPNPENLEYGGIVGVVDLTDIVRQSPSVWFNHGGVGLVLANPRVLPFKACKGQLGFFNIEYPGQ